MLFRRLLPALHLLQDLEPNESVANTLLDGLIASYQFENAADLGHDSYNFCNLSVVGSTGSVTQSTGKHNYGVTCSGKSLRGDAATDVDPGNGITLCGWFKCDNNTGSGHNRVLVCLTEAGASHTSANPDVQVLLNSSGGTHVPTMAFYDSSDTYRTLTLSAIADPTVWHFFVARFEDGNQSLQLDNGTPTTSTHTIDDVVGSPQTLRRVQIGSATTSDSVTADGVLIYNRVLTGYESDVLYDIGSGRFYGFGFEGTLSRATIVADSTTAVSGSTLSRVTLAADSTTAVSGGILSRATIVADSTTALSGGTLSRVTIVADSSEAVTAGMLSRVTVAADSTTAVTAGILSRVTIEADSTEAFVTDPGTLSRVTIVADSTTAVTGGVLSRVTLAADSTTAVTAGILSRTTIVADSTTLEFVDPAILQRVTIAATSNRTLPSVTAPEFKYVVLSNVLNQFGSKDLKFREETSNQITAVIKDEHGHALDETDFDFVLLTLYEKEEHTLLTPTEVVSGGQLSITDGALAWDLLPRDTNLIDDDREPGTGTETHTCLLEFCHGTETVEDLVDAFTTTADSNLIAVEHPAHALVAGNHVWYLAEEEVGGLTLTGLFLVQRIIDANSYEVVAHRTATATATGGGATVARSKGYSNKADITFKVVKADIL